MNTDPSSPAPGLERATPAGVAADAAARVAARFGVTGYPDLLGERRAAILPSAPDRDVVAQALAADYSHVVERDETGDAAGDWQDVPALRRGLYLSLTTGAAFGIQCAVLVCDALAARGVLTTEHRSVVELCLHEAIANAVVHGNLGIASAAKDHPEGYRVFSQLVNERLRDPAIRRRRMDLFARWDDSALVVGVCDQGAGFDVAILPEEADGNARSGRGFIFMRALAQEVTVTDGGRCTTLRFDR